MKLIFDIDSNSNIEKVDEINEATGEVEKKYKIKTQKIYRSFIRIE